MKIRLLFPAIAAALLATSLNIDAQSVRASVMQAPETAANIYYPYHKREGKMTPAPKGYKPFYISHYGRHGSRYLTGDYYFPAASKGLAVAEKEGLLTEEGKALWADFQAIEKEHEGMFGQLSPRGAREHRAISQRMYDRFKRVFRAKNRKEVNCVASIVPRCIISMANFTTVLNDNEPDLEFSYTTGDKYLDLLAHDIESENLYKSTRGLNDTLRQRICHYDKTFAKLFKDPERAAEVVGNPLSFMSSVYNTGSICEDLDWLGINIYKYIDREELAELAIVRNNLVYGELGNSKEWGDTVAASARWLLQDFVDKADSAIKEDSGVAADLRFGHDTGIMPFLTILEVEGNDERVPMAEGDKVWRANYMVPMGTNFQMVFYRGRKGDVIVKMLYNEAETAIKAVPAYEGPYYRWTDLKDYFLRKIRKYQD